MSVLRDLFICLIVLCIDCRVGASLPIESLSYSIPHVFEKQREIIYGMDEAEIYFSLKPLHNVKKVFISLRSSHPTKLLIETNEGYVASTVQQVFVLKGSNFKFKTTVKKVGDFSLASINLNVAYEFPKAAVINAVRVDPRKVYTNEKAKKNLLTRVGQISEFYEEDLGAFLYRNRFLKPIKK